MSIFSLSVLVSGRASARLAYICQFLPENVPFVPVKNKVAGTICRLKLSALCDLLEMEANGSSG